VILGHSGGDLDRALFEERGGGGIEDHLKLDRRIQRISDGESGTDPAKIIGGRPKQLDARQLSDHTEDRRPQQRLETLVETLSEVAEITCR